MCTHNWFCAKHFEKYSHHPSQRILFDALRNIVIAYVFFTRNLANQFCQVNSSWCWKLYSSDFKMKKLIQNWVLLIVLQTLTLGHIHLRIDFMSSVTFLVQSLIVKLCHPIHDQDGDCFAWAQGGFHDNDHHFD